MRKSGLGLLLQRLIAAWALVAWLGGTPSAAQSVEVRKKLELLAKSGNAEANYHLGMMHHLGIAGVKKNPRIAFDLFQRAEAGGDPLGAYKVGCYLDGQEGPIVKRDPLRALKSKLMSAEAGYSLAQYDIGVHFARSGKFEQALPWFRKAADQGEPLGLFAMTNITKSPGSPYKEPVWTYAYFELWGQLTGGTSRGEAKRFLNEARAALTPAQRLEAATLISNYRPRPSIITVKAKRGAAAAEDLIAVVKPTT